MKRVQDHYFRRAKREGYAARAAFKLVEIDRKRRLLRPGMRVLDLGCAPGSWLQVAAERVGQRGRVVGIDLQPVKLDLPAHVRIVTGDLLETPTETLAPDGQPFDLILSDMAPATTGVPSADAARSVALVEHALGLAETLLRPGGTLLAKVFQGADFPRLRAAFRERFNTVSVEKPKSSRSESVELFLLGRGYRPPAADTAPAGDDQPQRAG